MSDDCIYLAGNSLGLQPKGSQELVQHEMDKWSRKALYGHMEGKYPWYPIEDFLMEQYSHIVGCKKEEVTAMNSLTANIHFALVRMNSKFIFIVVLFSFSPCDISIGF